MNVDVVTAELRAAVRDHVRAELLRRGASHALDDPAIFAAVDGLLRDAVIRSQPSALLLPELLGSTDSWRLQTAVRYERHRGAATATAITFVKQRLLMPLLRWLFEYSRDNFERQQRVNEVLFACVQELAIENARLRRDLDSRR